MRILIADDDKAARLIVSAALGKAGHEVVGAEDGEQAWSILQQPDAPKLAVMDWILPKIEGIEVIRKFRATFATEPFYVILLTSLDEKRHLVRGLEAGADDYLCKPFDPTELRARVQVGARVLQLQSTLAQRVGDLEKALTARQKAEADRLLLTTAVEQAADAVVITDAEGRIQYVNPAFTRMTGYTGVDVFGQNPRLLKSDKQDAAFYRDLWKTILSGQIWHDEVVNRRKDGTLYTEEMTITPVRDPSGLITNFIAVKQDVTERKRAEEALHESEQRYRLLFSEMGVGFALHELICDQDGKPADYRFLAVNTAFEGLTGLRSNRILGKTVREVLPDIEPLWIERYGKVALNGESAHFESFAQPLQKYFELNAFCPRRGQFAVTFSDITGRKQAEEARSLLASIVEFSDDAIIGKDLGGTIVSWNRAAELLYGYRADEVTGRSVSILAPPGRPDEISTILEKIRRGDRISHFDTLRMAKDGRPVDVSLTISPIKNAVGEVTGAATIARDITELKRAEETIRQSEEKYRSLVANIPDVAWTLDGKGRFAFMSPNIQRVRGYTADEVYQRGADLLFESLHPDDAENVRKAFESLFTRGEAYNVEYRVQRKTGEWIWVNDRAVATYEKNGTRYADGLLSDITERKRAEAALRTSESRYRLLFETNVAAIIRNTTEGRIVDCNVAAARILGYESPQEMMGLSIRDIHWDPEKRVGLMARLQAEKTIAGAEVKFRHKAGRPVWLILNLSLTPPDDSGEAFVQGTLFDITERKRAEEELRLTQFSLEHASDAVHWVNAQGFLVYVNEAACRSLGRSREELLSLSVAEIDPLVLKEGWPAIWEKIRARGSVTFETEHLTKDGRVFPVEVTANYLEFNGKEYSFAFARDITERKRAEDELYQSRQMLQFILDNIPQQVFWKDRNLTYLGCNRAFAIDAGLRDPMEILGKNDFDLAWSGLAELYRADDRLVMEQETPKFNFEEQLSRADGSLLWVRTSKLPLRDREGRVAGVLGTYEDITERKRAEEALAEGARLSALRAEVGVALTRGGTLRAGLRECAEALVRHAGAAFARIWTLNEAAATLVLEASAGIYTHLDGPHGRVPVGSFKIGRIAQSQTPHFSNDVQTDPEVGDHAWAQREGLVSFVGHPLLVGNKLVGVVAAFGQRLFTEATLLAFASVANQIARFVHGKRAEEALQRSEAYLAESQRLSHVGSWAWDVATRELVYWSPEHYRIFGFDAGKGPVSFATALERVHPEDRRAVNKVVAGIVREQNDFEWDFRLLLPDGSIKYIHGTGHPVANERGEMMELVGTHADVTERKRAEARLTAQYQAALALADSGSLTEATPRILQAVCAPLGWDHGVLWVVDRKANVLRCAGSWHKDSVDVAELESAERQMTFPPGSGLAGSVWTSGQPLWIPDISQLRGFITLAGKGGLHAALTFPIVVGREVLSVMQLFSRGVVPPDEQTLQVLTTIGGQIGSWMERRHAEDERRRAEDALQRSEERARLLFATIPHPAYVVDLDTLEFLEVNDAAVERYGYSRDEFLHMTVTQIRPAEEQDQLKKYVQQIRSPYQGIGEWKHRTKDGRVVNVEASLHTFDYGGRRAAVVIAQDVTARKQLELELRHSQKLEAVGGLASGIAHELNTPIQFVGDNTHFLQDAFRDLDRVLEQYRQVRNAAAGGVVPPALLEEVAQVEAAADLDYLRQEIPKALEQSLDGVTRVARIVRAMKEFAHPDRSEKMATDINKSLESTLIVARNEIKYVADTETDFGELPLVLCHGGDINQVFLNLLVNAAHAIQDVAKDSGKTGLIRVTTRQEGDEVLISIADTGSGIPEDIRDKIFEPFFTTKGVGRGTGQGLAIARSIVVDKHGGSLTFDTEVGRGTTFHIRLPVDPDAARTEGAA